MGIVVNFSRGDLKEVIKNWFFRSFVQILNDQEFIGVNCGCILQRLGSFLGFQFVKG